MRLSVVIPVFNGASVLGITMDSIVNQRFEYEFEVILVDGASTDATVHVAKSYMKKIKKLSIISRPDNSMYEAVADGLQLCSGEIHTYINAGDFFFPNAFANAEQSFRRDEDIRWITGKKCREINNEIVPGINPTFNSLIIKVGLYGPVLPYIQQEGTFWHRTLTETLDLKKLSSLRLAGDYYMWCSFAESCDLVSNDTFMACFVVCEGQLSSDTEGYFNEMNTFTTALSARTLLPLLNVFVTTAFATIGFYARRATGQLGYPSVPNV
jgi:glycosyltransferase involved in cell wall biosynthesis